ncbi:tetratricopeptide repeat protein [Desulfomonile tiedjei]|uniref:Tetratricopeptide repeat protein n=1 Tax=Desulfomonile tiedjei (strain ATCC 49306 / DSM 6799 / DCB-1) TaxID=706587 RepID=I4CDQ1_DESTA|nr:tetratricopeptide repeat protein [Desulfomonile tiedjei]AFM27692.1 tetratricopeptide repeat protein [Desulfomonile tiedjei DSM 6799]
MQTDHSNPDIESFRPAKISRSYVLVLTLCLLALALIVQWPGLKAPMVYDSRVFIAEKAEVFSQEGVSGVVALYPGRALAMASFYLNYVSTGMDPTFFRLVNICLLAGCGIAVFVLVFMLLSIRNAPADEDVSLSLTVATLLAVLYLIHPLQTFLSLYIYQRMALMSSLCFLFAIALYIAARTGRMSSPYAGYFAAFLLYQIGMFSKPNIFTLPLVLLLAEIAFFRTGLKALCKLAIIFLIASIPYFAVMKIFVPSPEGISAPGTGFVASLAAYYVDSGITVKEQALTNCRVLFSYLSTIFVPTPSNVQLLQVQIISRSLLDPPSTLPAFLGVLILGGFGLLALKLRPLTGFGITFFLVTIIPESFLVPQYLYAGYRPVLPMVGLIFVAADVIGIAALKLKDRVGTRVAAKTVALVLVPLVCFFGAVTSIKATLWSNQLLFWKQSLEKFPPYGTHVEKKAYLDTLLNIGDAYCEVGRWKNAVHHYQQALEIQPNFATLHNNLGFALHEAGETELALEHLHKAMELNPQMPDAFNNAGLVFFRLGNTQKAIDYFTRAIELHPGFVPAYANLGSALIQANRIPDAIRILSKALQLDPYSAQTHNNLGFAYYRSGDSPKAVEHFRKTLEIEPGFQEARENMTRALQKK